MCQLLSLMLDFFWQIFQFTFFKAGLVSFLSFLKVLDEAIGEKLFHSYFSLSYISCLFLNSTCFKACFENHSRIFINEHLRGNFLALDWIAISFLVPVLQMLQAFLFQTFRTFLHILLWNYVFWKKIIFIRQKSLQVKWFLWTL